MSIFLLISFLVIGIVLLMISGDYLIKGGVDLANRFKVSGLVIGLTVVAFGTSAPELIVSLDASITGHPEMALGNVIGSNIANIALVLGLTVLILPMPVSESTIKRSWPVMFMASIVLYFTMINNSISHGEGLLMVLLLVLFIYDSVRTGKRERKLVQEDDVVKPKYTMLGSLLIVVLSVAGLSLGSTLLIKGASGIALALGVSERVISLTVVAFGTSIPELTASIVAAFKKETDISVGNIIGSNIFNVFAVIGLSATVKKIEFSFLDFRIDLIYMLIIAACLLLFALPWKNMFGNGKPIWKNVIGGKLGRFAGLAFVAIYVVYLYNIL